VNKKDVPGEMISVFSGIFLVGTRLNHYFSIGSDYPPLTMYYNQVLILAGKNPLPFSDNEIGEVICFIITAVAAIWNWWKNNSFTQTAIEADKFIKEKRNSHKEDKV